MRVSTAVLLTRGGGGGLEVYLVRRSERLRFFGGYWAFPGGVVDEGDRDGERESDGTHRRCGLRELFEETGVLPSAWAASLSDADRRRLRENLVADHGPSDAGAGFRELADREPSALAGARPFARLTTPAFAPVRYRTCFVQFELPPGQVPDVWHGELTEGEFAAPGTWLERWRAGELPIAPPVLFLLDMLDGAPLEGFLERAGQRCRESGAGRWHPICSTPGVLMLPLPTVTLPPATTTNCYIVGNERLFVVDPATRDRAAQERLFEFLDERLARPGTERSPAGVLVTHHHADHVGAVEAVARRYSCPVYAHPLTLSRLPHEPRDPRALNDGDELPLGTALDGSAGWVLRAYHTPGHDRGHLVFVDSRHGAALAGDLVSTVSSIIIDPPEGHLATYLESLRRMLTVPMGMLHPAHGPVAREGHRVLSAYLEHRAEREAELLAALGRGGGSVGELVADVYRDVSPDLHGFAARSLSAGLEKLAEEQRVVRRGDRWALID